MPLNNHDIKKIIQSVTVAVSGSTSVAICSKVFIPNTSTNTNFRLLCTLRGEVSKLCQPRNDSLSLQASKFMRSLSVHLKIPYAYI